MDLDGPPGIQKGHAMATCPEMGMEVLYGSRRVIGPAGEPGVFRPIPIELWSFQCLFLTSFISNYLYYFNNSRPEGLEPSTSGLGDRRSTNWTKDARGTIKYHPILRIYYLVSLWVVCFLQEGQYLLNSNLSFVFFLFFTLLPFYLYIFSCQKLWWIFFSDVYV